MVTLYLVESVAAVRSAVRLAGRDDVVLAFDEVVRYALVKAGVDAHGVGELYRHDELWSLYPGTNDISRGLVDAVTAELRAIDADGADLFRYFSYPIKINTDQALHFAFLIRKAVARWSPDHIVCCPAGAIVLDSAGLFSSNENMLAHILRAMGLRFEAVLDDEKNKDAALAKQSRKTLFSFGQPSIAWLRSAVGRARQKRNVSSVNAGHLRVLSVGCRELETASPEIPELTVIPYSVSVELQTSTVCPELIQAALLRVAQSESVQCGGAFGINLAPLLLPCLEMFCGNLAHLSKHLSSMAMLLRKERIDAVAVQTLSSFHLPAILLHSAATAADIPVVCWMHGGYGAYPSLPGYDETDYRIGRYHAVYGQAIVDCIHDEKSVLRKQGLTDNIQLVLCGSPYLRSKHARSEARLAGRPKIVLGVGAVHVRNNFYYGYDRPYSELSCFDAHVRIIKILAEFSDRYDIVVKDYPQADAARLAVWADLLRDYPNVEVIHASQTFSSVIENASAVILPWVSTTFVETLFTSADILLFDDSGMTATASDMLAHDIVFASNIDAFSIRLDAYLSAGTFGLQDKSRLRRYFAEPLADGAGQAISEFLRNLTRLSTAATTARVPSQAPQSVMQ